MNAERGTRNAEILAANWRLNAPPHANTTPRLAFLRRRIREVLDLPDDQVKASALRAARDAFPHHPLVLLCLAK